MAESATFRSCIAACRATPAARARTTSPRSSSATTSTPWRRTTTARPSGTTSASLPTAPRSTHGGCPSARDQTCRHPRLSRTVRRRSETATYSAARTPIRRLPRRVATVVGSMESYGPGSSAPGPSRRPSALCATAAAAALHEAALLHLRAALLHRAPAPAVVAALVEEQPAAVAADLQVAERAGREQLDRRVRDRQERVGELSRRRPRPAHRAVGRSGVGRREVRAGERVPIGVAQLVEQVGGWLVALGDGAEDPVDELTQVLCAPERTLRSLLVGAGRADERLPVRLGNDAQPHAPDDDVLVAVEQLIVGGRRLVT